MTKTITALLLAVGLLAAATPAEAHYQQQAIFKYTQVVDLDPTADGAFDDATAVVYYRSDYRGTRIWLAVFGVDSPSRVLPVHLHTGTCADMGGHYQDQKGGAVDKVNEAWPTANQYGSLYYGRSLNPWMVRPGDDVVIGLHRSPGEGATGCIQL